MADDAGMGLRDKSQDNTRSGFEKREKRRRIRKLQDAISQNQINIVQQMMEEDFDVDFQYRGQTALQLAVKEGLYDMCVILIMKGADVNKIDSDMNSLLNIASWRGFDDIVELLIQNKADVDSQNDLGCTPLNTCAYKGHAYICNLLLKAGADSNIQNSHGQTPLHTAAKQRHVEIVDLLKNSSCNMNPGDENRKTPMIWAADLGFADIVESLLLGGADPDKQDNLGRTALYCAASQGYLEVTQVLIKRKANLNLQTTKGCTPLLDAIGSSCSGSLDIAKLLISSGCDVNLADRQSQAPIHVAVRQVSQMFGSPTENALALVKILVSGKCDVNQPDSEGWTPLYQAALAGNQEITTMLLEGHADVKIQTKNGNSVLHAGAMGNSLAVVNTLLAAGCDVNIKNSNNEHALFAAITSRSNIQIVNALIKSGSDIDLKEKKFHCSTLHQAIIQHYTEAALLLIESGCNINAVTAKLQTPLYTAAEKGNEIVTEKLTSMPKCLLNGTKHSTVPLHVAVTNNHSKVAKILIKAGCNINQMNEKCMTPIMAATEENNEDVAMVLLRYGCDLNGQAKVSKVLPCCIVREDPHPHFDLEPLFLALTHKNVKLLITYMKFYFNIPYKLIKVLSDILRTSRDMNTQYSPAQKKTILAVFDQTLKHPRKLQEISRALIREKLGSRPEIKLKGLTLASKLKDYVLMSDVLGEEEEEEEPSQEEKERGRFGLVLA